MKLNTASQWKEKCLKRGKIIRETFTSSQESHKIKLTTIIYSRRFSTDPSRSCVCCFSLCELIFTLFSWFRRTCSPGVIYPFWHLQSFCVLFHYFIFFIVLLLLLLNILFYCTLKPSLLFPWSPSTYHFSPISIPCCICSEISRPTRDIHNVLHRKLQ